MTEYIERDAVIRKFADRVKASNNSDFVPVPTWNEAVQIVEDFPAADVRHVIVCAKCRHNNHCFTQAFIDDCGKIPLDRNTFFCADGESGE